MGNPVVHWQITTPDPAGASDFYGNLFGWKTSQDNALGYRMVKTGGTGGVDGGFWPVPTGGQPAVVLFVQVEDVRQTAKNAEHLGGRVLVPPQVLPDGDEMAILQDPQGIVMGLASLKSNLHRKQEGKA